jgi:hypothetical protein
MDEMTRFRISGPIWVSRLAFLLFLPAGLFFGGMLFYQPPEDSWLKHAVMSVLILFFIGSLRASFGTWRLQELEVDWRRRHCRVKEGKVFFSRWRDYLFQKVTAISVEKKEYPESTRYIVNLALDGRSFPVFEFSAQSDAEEMVDQIRVQLNALRVPFSGQ